MKATTEKRYLCTGNVKFKIEENLVFSYDENHLSRNVTVFQ